MFLTVAFKQWLNTHIQLCELDCKEGRMPKKWCLRTVVLEKTPERPLGSKEIKPVNLKGDHQPWIFNGRTDTEVETPVYWSSDVNSWLIGKVPDAGKDWGQKEEEDVKGWDGWMASPTGWTWTWVNSERWWRTGKPSVLQSMGSQRVRRNLATERQMCVCVCVCV